MCAIVADHTAGDPTRPDVIWTDRTPKEIQERLGEKDIDVGLDVIRDVLASQGYRKRKMSKYLDMGSHADRDAPFQNLARIRAEYLGTGDPVLSIDTKKRELLGTFYRDGRVYTQQPIRAFDHDFPSHADVVVVPYGVYDVGRNLGYVNLGTSRDTSAFACDSVGWWWDQFGRRLYPGSRRVLLLCDGGGSNSATKYLFKEDLQNLSHRLGLELRIGHYPPYCSKYNPIERCWGILERHWNGTVFASVADVLRWAATMTWRGLHPIVRETTTAYERGVRVARAAFRTVAARLIRSATLPKWSLTIQPQEPGD